MFLAVHMPPQINVVSAYAYVVEEFLVIPDRCSGNLGNHTICSTHTLTSIPFTHNLLTSSLLLFDQERNPQYPFVQLMLEVYICKQGDSCALHHIDTPTIICKHYIQNNCKFGELCLFKHPPKPDKASSDLSPVVQLIVQENLSLLERLTAAEEKIR